MHSMLFPYPFCQLLKNGKSFNPFSYQLFAQNPLPHPGCFSPQKWKYRYFILILQLAYAVRIQSAMSFKSLTNLCSQARPSSLVIISCPFSTMWCLWTWSKPHFVQKCLFPLMAQGIVPIPCPHVIQGQSSHLLTTLQSLQTGDRRRGACLAVYWC